MVDHQVDQNAYATLPASVGELHKITQGAVARIDAVVIRDVVAIVAMRRDLKRHQPDRRDAEAVQVIEAAHQAGEIADAVAIGIHVGADRQAVDDRVLVPEIVDHSRFARGSKKDPPGKRVAAVLSSRAVAQDRNAVADRL